MKPFITPEQPGHHPDAYKSFLELFIDRGYEFITFDELVPNKGGQVVMRHDIDFDTAAALRIAEVEAEMNIRSTYFFLLCSKSYNLLSPADTANVKAIQELGHQVSLHFDATLYTNVLKGLRYESNVFKACFGTEVRLISFHRPDTNMIRKHDRPFLGIEHTYQSKYFRDIKYVSDSTGVWRFGHPSETQEFEERRSMQVLIHPIWWTFAGRNNVSKLEAYLEAQAADLRSEVAKNCIPFRKKQISIELPQDRLVRVQGHDVVAAKDLEVAKLDRVFDNHRSAAGSEA